VSTDIEKIKSFKRLYVATHQLFVEQKVDQAIENIDVLIGMLPLEFPGISQRRKDTRVLLINLEDAEDEPEEKLIFEKGLPKFVIPENARLFYDVDMPTVLDDWKFSMWNRAVELSTDPAIRKKYLALTLVQANYCIAQFAKKEIWMDWDVTLFVKYTNHIGWVAYLEEQDTAKLEIALEVLEKGFSWSNWNHLRYIKNTKVRLLLELGKKDEAFLIVEEAFKQDPDYEDFLDLKTDVQYTTWVKEKAAQEEEAKREKERAYQVFLELVAVEQAKIADQFEYPEHPLVIKHADVLNLIKQRIISAKLHLQYDESNWKTADEEKYKKELTQNKLSVEKLEQFEREKGLHLPDELKVYLMEIGEGGRYYFSWEGITLPNEKQVERAKKPFPIIPDKIHDIKHAWGIKAWVYSDDKDWIKQGTFKDAAEMEARFGLPETAVISDGCIALPSSNDQDGLYLIMNGTFENEVWVNTLQYGADAGGCFGAASAQQFKFLEFIAESLLARQHNYDYGQGAWM
jgi:tetratricopeptide (TPR) repeat protein